MPAEITATPPAPPLRYWRLVAPFAVAAALLAIPFFMKKEVEIRADLLVSEMSFTCEDASAAALLNDIAAETISFRGFREVRFSTGHMEAGAMSAKGILWKPVGTVDGGTVTRRADGAQISIDKATVNRMQIAPGSKVTLAWNRSAPAMLSAKVEGEPFRSELVVEPQATFECQNCGGALPESQSSSFRINARREQILAVLGENQGSGFWLNVPNDRALIEGPLLVRDDLRFLTKPPDVNNYVSAIIGEGHISIPEMSKERKVHAGELLAISGASNLRIVSLAVNHGLHLELSGTATGLQVGEEGATQDILPSLLEWLHARSPVLLLIQDLVIVGTAVLAVLTRLRMVPKE